MPWSPTQYLKFSTERFAPFDDLVKIVDWGRLGSEIPAYAGMEDGRSVVDLGCGTGELTLKLAGMMPNASILGIDNSAEMLEKAKAKNDDDDDDDENENEKRVRFELMSIEDFAADRGGSAEDELFDLIFSNAALHWVGDHPKLLERLWERLKPGGQIAVQVPSGVRNRAQRIVMEEGERLITNYELRITNGINELGIRNGNNNEPAVTRGGMTAEPVWKFPVLPVDEYAENLYKLGATDIVAFENVYPHVLKDGEAVYEWVAGTTMNAYLEGVKRMKRVDEFKAEVKKKVVEAYPGSPVIFPFRRIFFAGRK